MKARCLVIYGLITILFLQPLVPVWAVRPERVSGQALAGIIQGHSAAGITAYAFEEGKPKILLGLRNDGKGWCSFGGKATPTDASLAHVADRETAEETNGIISRHPRQLKNEPFHDIWTEKDGILSLFRLYFLQTPLIPVERFMQRQADATEAHSREYVQYRWADLEDLVEAKIEGVFPDFARIIHEVGRRLLKEMRPSESFLEWENSYSYKGPQSDFQPTYERAPVFADWTLHAEEVLVRHVLQSMPTSFLGESPACVTVAASRELTLSEMHLAMVLGKEFRDPRTGDLRDAHTHNLTQYLVHYPLEQDIVSSRSSDFVIQRGVDLLVEEVGRFPQYNVLSHGLEGANLFLYAVWSQLINILLASPSTTLRLRGHDLYFHGKPDTLPALKEMLGEGDYVGFNNALLLCVNPGLVVGPGHTASTSNSLRYWAGDHSVETGRQGEFFQQLMLLLGVPSARFSPYLSLYLQHIARDKSNGGMLQIFFDPQDADELLGWGYHAKDASTIIDPITAVLEPWRHYMPSAPKTHALLAQTVNGMLHEHPIAQRDPIKPALSTSYGTIIPSDVQYAAQSFAFSEGRLYVPPSQRSKVRIQGHYFHPLSSAEEQEVLRQMRTILALDLVDGVVANLPPVPNTISGVQKEWPIAAFLRLLYEGSTPLLTGHSQSSVTSEQYHTLLFLDAFDVLKQLPIPTDYPLRDVIVHMIEVGFFDGVSALLMEHGDLLQEPSLRLRALQAALTASDVQGTVQAVDRLIGITPAGLSPEFIQRAIFDLMGATFQGHDFILPFLGRFLSLSEFVKFVGALGEVSVALIPELAKLPYGAELLRNPLVLHQLKDDSTQSLEATLEHYVDETVLMRQIFPGRSYLSHLLEHQKDHPLLERAYTQNSDIRVPETGRLLIAELLLRLAPPSGRFSTNAGGSQHFQTFSGRVPFGKAFDFAKKNHHLLRMIAQHTIPSTMSDGERRWLFPVDTPVMTLSPSQADKILTEFLNGLLARADNDRIRVRKEHAEQLQQLDIVLRKAAGIAEAGPWMAHMSAEFFMPLSVPPVPVAGIHLRELESASFALVQVTSAAAPTISVMPAQAISEAERRRKMVHDHAELMREGAIVLEKTEEIGRRVFELLQNASQEIMCSTVDIFPTDFRRLLLISRLIVGEYMGLQRQELAAKTILLLMERPDLLRFTMGTGAPMTLDAALQFLERTFLYKAGRALKGLSSHDMLKAIQGILAEAPPYKRQLIEAAGKL